MTEIGEIPEEWALKPFSEVLKLRKKKSREKLEELYTIPMNLIPDNRIYCGYRPLEENEVLPPTYCEPGDILLPKITPSIENGKQGIVPNLRSGHAFATSEVYSIVAETGLTNLFTFYLLKMEPFRQPLINSMVGTTGRQRVPKDSLFGLHFPVPSISEQQKIAEILSTADREIELIDSEIEATEKLKKGLMQTLLTRGIGHTKFKMTEIGEIPEEWKLGNLSSISENENDIVAGPFGSNLKVSDYTEVGFPIIRLQNIAPNSFIYKDIKYIREEKAKELAYHSFMAGDIVLAKLGDPIGTSCIIPAELPHGIIVADVVRIRVSYKKADKLFVVQSLNSPICLRQLKSAKIGSTRPRVNLSDVRNLKLFIPSLPEQQKIAEILTTVDEKLELLTEKKQILETVKKGLMCDLLTGKVRVRTDPIKGDN